MIKITRQNPRRSKRTGMMSPPKLVVSVKILSVVCQPGEDGVSEKDLERWACLKLRQSLVNAMKELDYRTPTARTVIPCERYPGTFPGCIYLGAGRTI